MQEDDVIGVFEELAVPLLASPQGFFRHVAPGFVLNHRDPGVDPLYVKHKRDHVDHELLILSATMNERSNGVNRPAELRHKLRTFSLRFRRKKIDKVERANLLTLVAVKLQRALVGFQDFERTGPIENARQGILEKCPPIP